MIGVDLVNADLGDAYVGGCNLVGANLKNANLAKANLEKSDLTESNLKSARLSEAYCDEANFSRAKLERANLDAATLSRVNFDAADLRGSTMIDAVLDDARMTGAQLAGANVEPGQLEKVFAEWVDFSTATRRSRVDGLDIVDYLTRLRSGQSEALQPVGRSTRYFGKGDVLSNATLMFGEGSVVDIESRFENCKIELNQGAHLTIGRHGVMNGCKIAGPGEIVVEGEFSVDETSPSIIGPTRLSVGAAGALSAIVKQASGETGFAFESGCYLRLKIQR